MRPPVPPFFLRAAILFGVAATLAGVAGLVLIGPASPAQVVVEGVGDRQVEVHLTWREGTTAFRERLVPARTAGRWHLPDRVPAGTPATVHVVDGSGREIARAPWSPGSGSLRLRAENEPER